MPNGLTLKATRGLPLETREIAMEPRGRWIALVITLITFSAHSAETADPVGETSDALSDCSGFYLFLARAPQSQSKPASVSRLLEFAKDATLAAT
jgi:hypothetical protein